LLESKSGSEILVDIASNEMSNMFVNAPLISPQIIIPIINKIRLKGHSDTVHAVCYMKNSNRIITGSRDKTIKIWNIENGDCLTTLMGHSNMISSLILISDTKLASAGWDNLIKIWDLNTNKCIRTYKGHDKWVECLCLFKNLQLISGSFDNTIKIWDLNSTSCIKTLKGIFILKR
jgi:WD40 repeat protein